jgi:phage terminase Nu1 subunit (DNA packaging protein)
VTEQKKGKRKRLLTRQEIAAEFGCTPGTITRWERDGCPVAQKTTRGRPSLFDLEAVRTWRAEMDRIAPEALSLEHERARLARAQVEKTERENLVRAGELMERAQVILEGQSYSKAIAKMIRALPRRAVQAGAIAASQEHALAVLCRDVLVEISSWKYLEDLTSEPDDAPVGEVA